jgi:kynurenine 3-monooxygenase
LSQNKITIVGGGLAGSLLSVMLGQRGYDVTVYEKRPDMRQKDVDAGRSINLALARRGIKALSAAGLNDDVEPLLIPMKGRQLHLLGGEKLFSPYGLRDHEVIFSVSRELLNSLMMDAAEEHELVNVVFEHSCEAIDFENKQVTFQDLKSNTCEVVDYDILIGCDGAGSRVRRQMLPLCEGTASSEFLDHDYKELTIPPGTNGEHQILKEALHIWPRGGYMLIALPNLDGSFTVTLFMPKTGAPSFESLGDASELKEFFEAQFPSAMELIPDLATEFFENPTGRLGTLRCEPWFYGDSVAILGDASHAIVPFHGQGMNAAFEDCEILADLLDKNENDWGRTVSEFSQVRKPHAEAIADMALENYITMRDSVMDEQFQLKKEVGFELEKKYPKRFIPRYSMVMFHSIGYADAFARGEIQDELLGEVTAGKQSLAQVDLDLAGRLVTERLEPLG